MGKPELILRRGARTLDLNDQVRYWLAQDFVPPSAQLSTQISEGSSSNRYKGGTVTSWKAADGSVSFTVRLAGSSGLDVQAAIRAVSYILKPVDHGDEALYLEYRPNSDIPKPSWGQTGAAARYEVVRGDCTLGDGYLIGVRRNEDVNLVITLMVKPFRMGRLQRICTATGGVMEDLISSVVGSSQGLMVPEATTNKLTNPVFNHGTWDTGWTAGSSLVSAQNIDPAWLIPGAMNSARLNSSNTSNNTYTASVNVGNTNKHSLSCYARLPDGGVISSTQVQLYYNAALTTTYTALGNGWYWLRAENFSGANAARATGVVVKSQHTIFVSGFQLEEKIYCTPIGWGDLLGWAWTGTQNASESTRTAASIKTAIGLDTVSAAQGSLRMVVRYDVPSTHTNLMQLFDMRDASHLNALQAYYSAADDIFILSENAGTVVAYSDAQTFSARTSYVLHFTWGAFGLALYVNGVLDGNATIANHSYYAPGESLFFGSDYSGANQIIGALQGAALFDFALTEAQVLADYTDIAPAVTRGDRLDAIPYLWTLGGDNVLSLDTDKQPLGVVGGVPGTFAAITEIQGTVSSNWSTIKSIALSSYACNLYLGMGPLLYNYGATAGAGDYGGTHKTTTVNGADILLSPVNSVLPIHIPDQINGMEYYTLARLYGSAATAFSLYSSWSNSSSSIKSDLRATTPAGSSAYRMFRTNPNRISFNTEGFTGRTSSQIVHYIYGSKIATNVDISVDYIAILPRPCLFITGGRESNAGFILKGVAAYHAVTGFTMYPLVTTGDVIEFLPSKLNHLLCYFCPDGTVDPVTTYSATFSAIFITPRWTLL